VNSGRLLPLPALITSESPGESINESFLCPSPLLSSSLNNTFKLYLHQYQQHLLSQSISTEYQYLCRSPIIHILLSHIYTQQTKRVTVNMKFTSTITLVIASLSFYSLSIASPEALAKPTSGLEMSQELTERVAISSVESDDGFKMSEHLMERQDPCRWGNVWGGPHGFGCYCSSGCLDPTGVCDLPLGQCHSGAMKLGVRALTSLAAAGAVVVSIL